jgi:hypothetical protein
MRLLAMLVLAAPATQAQKLTVTYTGWQNADCVSSASSSQPQPASVSRRCAASQ